MPLASKPLKTLTIKTLFLLFLATAKRVGNFQAFSFCVAFKGSDISLSSLLEFVAMTESRKTPLSCSFLVKSLEEFVGDLQKRCCCVLSELLGRIWMLLLPCLLIPGLCSCLLIVLRGYFQRMPCHTFSIRSFLLLQPYRVI